MEKQKGKLLLQDGTTYEGELFGAMREEMVEVVFNTSMVGYQEILSDPSYTDQAVVMTYPLIGNYGMCEEDYETDRPSIAAFIVREYCEEPSNFRAKETLEDVMKRYGITGLSGVDTRALTRHIRNFGSMKGFILPADADKDAALEALQQDMRRDQVSRVTSKEMHEFLENAEEGQEFKYRVAVLDCGIKKNILRSMVKRDILPIVLPFDTPASEIEKLNADGLFISNGPGDPTGVMCTAETIHTLTGKLPIFGICLGHQLIALSYGAETYKLKFGHRGGNHPVMNLKTGKIEITSQNHSYAVKPESLADKPLTVTHENILDKTIEGMECMEDYVFSVQYHPESAPGPEDSGYLFDRFTALMDEFKEVHHA